MELQLIWNDPEPIDGNDYRITLFKKDPDSDIALIQYNGGLSEAEVPMSEIAVMFKLKK